MPVKNGDFIKLEYTGKIVETGDIFDTTDKELAEEKGIFSDKKNLWASFCNYRRRPCA